MSAWKSMHDRAACFALGVSTLMGDLSQENAQAQAPAVDPAAVQKLKRMTQFLDGVQQFSVQTQNVIEELHVSGHRVEQTHPRGECDRQAPQQAAGGARWRTPGPALLL